MEHSRSIASSSNPVPEWRVYHEATRHSPESLRRSPHYLIWANMPDPFRHYEGAPVVDLVADPYAPELPVLDVLNGRLGPPAENLLSSLLYHSAAISSVRVPANGYRYALRVNPSSGNLHPTEFHFAARNAAACADGIYHYRPSSHMLEQRMAGTPPPQDSALEFLLTSIAWREAWKYRDRAYRYCLLDIGHAWQALALAARALGCETREQVQFDDRETAAQWGLAGDEWPMLRIAIAAPQQHREPRTPEWHGGEPNRLSADPIEYASITRVHEATTRPCDAAFEPPAAEEATGAALPAAAHSPRPFGETVRARRTARDFRGGSDTMRLDVLAAILDAATQPVGGQFVELWLYVHRVEGLAPGVYRYFRHARRLALVREGDQRAAAAGLSLGQDLAGNACVAFSMLADLARATRCYGDRGYRHALIEAGAIGQRLYLAAEAFRLRATGIGAFFDEHVQHYLDVSGADRSVVYHFAIGWCDE